MAGSSHRLRVAACAVTALLALSCTTPTQPMSLPPVSLTVAGVAHRVVPGTTFGDLIRDLQLHARAGRLLSVNGRVLDPRLDPGEILVNGAPALHSTPLLYGDVVAVVSGVDATEGTERVARILNGRHPAVPQRTLATYPLKQIDTVGRVSGELLTTEFRPVGPGQIPRAVALTFDDGPWPGQTMHVLRILRRYHAKATFFMVGSLVERYPAIVSEVMNDGMTIGDHSWSHPLDPPFAELPPRRLAAEVLDTADQLRAVGAPPYLFRPPGGSYDDAVLLEARQAGMRTVTWDVDPADYRPGTKRKELARSVLSHVRRGSIVLMHDGGGDQHATIGALPLIIKGIRKMGLKLVAIPQDR
ncbi:MAG: polysaccharide deacetylase family protein [Actinobacteria bacterium]|nr:polysaccharide deacetylase family protein [Actinomycetota bacterium]